MDLTHGARNGFDSNLRAAAVQLLDSGRISDVRILQKGRVVTGTANPHPDAAAREAAHRVYIRYRQTDTSTDELTLEGECTCGDITPCPHVAAVALFAARNATLHPADSRREAVEAAPQASQQGLCYALELIDDVCSVSVWVAHLSADRREIPGGAHLFARRSAEVMDDYPRYVDAADRAILGALPRQPLDRWPLRGVSGFALLQRMVGTGRAVWQLPHGRTLRPGATRDLELEWRACANGEQRLHCAGGEALHILVSVEPAAFVDTSRNECGGLRHGYDLELLRRYWHRPALAAEEVAGVHAWLSSHPGAERFPRPTVYELLRHPLSTLRGSLRLSAGPQATLNFLYNEHLIASSGLRPEDDTVRRLDGVIHEIERDRDSERALHAQLDVVMREPPIHRDAWLRFMVESLPALRSAGWSIVIDPDFPYRLAPVADWYADLAATGRPEWFDLRLGVRVGGTPVNLLPALVDYLQDMNATAAPSLLEREHLFVPLEDGRYLPVPTARIRRIAETLVELFDRGALNAREALSLPRAQAGRLALLAQDAATSALRADDPSLLSLIDELDDLAGISPLPAPPECRATLRGYQQEGLGWLQFLRRHRLGGILADDMGLGKTVQSLAHLALEKGQGRLRKPALIVAPVSVLGNWQLEIRRFTPCLTAVTLQGSKRHRLFPTLSTFDVIITGYPSLLFDAEMLLDREFSIVILDEAQTIKNPHAKVSQVARALRTEHRLCLTGTPMQNHLGDLWSLCDFVQPGLLGTKSAFQRQYRTPIEKGGNTLRAETLRRRIAPFLLRRTKDSVARELPPKTEIIESIVMDEKQRDLYDGIRLSMHRRVCEAIEQQGLARCRITLLDALLKLRQVCCDPRLLGAAAPRSTAAPEPTPSAKLDWLSNALPELIAEGRRILLFSQFASMLRLIEGVVNDLSIPYCLLTGDTLGRAAVIERFQSGRVPLFLVSLKAGGAGLNLTAADTVIHYDPWWNPAVEMQATDRAHRIGQDKPVFVYKLIAERTVEEKILRLQADKRALVSQLYAAENATPSLLSAADLETLFGP